jgi:hypothetical protein
MPFANLSSEGAMVSIARHSVIMRLYRWLTLQEHVCLCARALPLTLLCAGPRSLGANLDIVFGPYYAAAHTLVAVQQLCCGLRDVIRAEAHPRSMLGAAKEVCYAQVISYLSLERICISYSGR